MPVTDEQIIDYLALGDTTIVEADPETDEGQHYETAEQPGQGVWETARYLGVEESRVHQLLRSHWAPSGDPGWTGRQEVDRRFRSR